MLESVDNFILQSKTLRRQGFWFAYTNINRKKKSMMGVSRCAKKKINTNKTINPYRSSIASMLRHRYGSTAKSTFEPSSGGIGIRLNMASQRFIFAISKAIWMKFVRNTPEIPAEMWDENLISKVKHIAISKFASGPIPPTMAGPHFWFFRLYAL